jgi:hypothetical protein
MQHTVNIPEGIVKAHRIFCALSPIFSYEFSHILNIMQYLMVRNEYSMPEFPGPVHKCLNFFHVLFLLFASVKDNQLRVLDYEFH